MSLILIADDDPNVTGVLEEYLKSRGHSTAVVHDGSEAAQKAEEIHPDLIIMDIQMPGAYGTTAVKTIRDIPSVANTPVIFLTGVPLANARKIIQEDDKTRLLAKPLDLNTLSAAIDGLAAK